MRKIVKKNKFVIYVALACLFVAYMALGASASDTAGVSVSANVAPGLELTMSTAPINFGGGALAPGSSATGSTIASVNSNKVWSLQVKKGGDLQINSSTTIPSEDLKYTSTSGSGKVHNLVSGQTEFTTSDAAVCSVCDRGSAMSLTVNYFLTVPWEAEPGVYQATHTYTATQP